MFVDINKLLPLIADAGISMRKLSLDLSEGSDPDYLRDVKRGKNSLTIDDTRKIHEITGIPYDDFAEPAAIRILSASSQPAAILDRVPIYYSAAAGDGAEIVPDIIGYVPRPDKLAHVKDAFAVRVVGESMEPALRQGWLVYVNPKQPPMTGDLCILERTDGSALVKELGKLLPDSIEMRQYNPAKSLKISRADVKGLYSIVQIDPKG